ncbi:hypothetical protein [Dactylosporangium sp. NPDC051541]|uniref:hypothetical protein n=1 Tax=Dactylosporangium sp. NPDC051541 TaxID=3363977 RepID=UPI0037A55F17
MAVSYIVLRPDLETTLARARERAGRELRDVGPITGLYGAFAQLGEELEAHVIDTSGLSAEQTCAVVRRALAAGEFAIGPQKSSSIRP